jgi:hypothetical protein
MKIVAIMENKIKNIPSGHAFTYTFCDIEVERKNTIRFFEFL